MGWSLDYPLADSTMHVMCVLSCDVVVGFSIAYDVSGTQRCIAGSLTIAYEAVVE